MLIVLLALLIGIIAGLRVFTAVAATSWAAYLGWLPLDGTWLAFLGHQWAPYIATVLAAGELIADQLPSTASRKVPSQFGARIVTGAVCGAAFAITGSWLGGLVAGVVGAIVGTLGGYEFRTRLTAATGRGIAIALLEDVIALAGAILVVRALA